MNLGKCTRCAKTVYDIEGYRVGPPSSIKIYHKTCFKCTTCNWQLTLTNYKFWEDKPYCKNHYPVTGFGDENAAHVHATTDVNSAHIAPQLNAPKLDTYNQTVRGTSQEAPKLGSDSIGISNAMSAPKGNLVNTNIRGGSS